MFHQQEKGPVTFGCLTVYPEFYCGDRDLSYVKTITEICVVGIRNTEQTIHTTVKVKLMSENRVFTRYKVTPFEGEAVFPSLKLEAFNLNRGRILGVVICKEIMYPCIAEVYRLMGVNMLSLSISRGDFKDMQREAWIDHMHIFSDICKCPVVVCSGANTSKYGLNGYVNPELAIDAWRI